MCTTCSVENERNLSQWSPIVELHICDILEKGKAIRAEKKWVVEVGGKYDYQGQRKGIWGDGKTGFF